jgi:protocatechuate 3,4-dioxygenase beta subunit
MDQQERLRTIYRRCVEAIRPIVTEMKITEDELHAAGRYFNRLGESGMCPSLLDVAFAMTSIDATRRDVGGTRPNLEGPYYMPGAPLRADGVLFDGPPPPHAPLITLKGRILDARTTVPVPGAELDIWHADQDGIYDRQGFYLRGKVRTDDQGRYVVRTIMPNDYAEHDLDPIGELFRALGRHNHRAAHIHFKIWTGGVERLMTQLFIPFSKVLPTDYVIGAVSDDLTLKLKQAPAVPGQGPQYTSTFDFRVVAQPQLEAAE